MPKRDTLTLSIVIPVYNEEHHIRACLDAIANQTVAPLEVIIVDNNCVDKTIAIAKTYKFVRVLKEPIQGRTVSRNRGFNAAKGEIIGRIDADSIVLPNWVERVIKDFKDPSVDGVAGVGRTRVLITSDKWRTTFWSIAYFWTVHSLHRVVTMWGANMAIRKSAWYKIRKFTAPDGSKVHEDQDLSLALAGHGGKIIQDNKLLINTDGVSYLYWPKFWNYFKKTFSMRSYHKQKGTYDRPEAITIGFWEQLPSAILGWTLTGVFIIYSLISWPFIALRMRIDPGYGEKNR